MSFLDLHKKWKNFQALFQFLLIFLNMFLTIYIIGLIKRIFSFESVVGHVVPLKDIVKSDYTKTEENEEIMLVIAYHEIY